MTWEDYVQSASDSVHMEESWKAWYRIRKKRILSSVEASDILRYFGVSLTHPERGESIPCPFHGDNRPSAKYHPEKPGKPSHLWCYVCRKNWDAVALWASFMNLSYKDTLSAMERHLVLPPIPKPLTSLVAIKKTDREAKIAALREKLTSLERILCYRIAEYGAEIAPFAVAADRLWYLLEESPEKLERLIGPFSEKLCSCHEKFGSRTHPPELPSLFLFSTKQKKKVSSRPFIDSLNFTVNCSDPPYLKKSIVNPLPDSRCLCGRLYPTSLPCVEG